MKNPSTPLLLAAALVFAALSAGAVPIEGGSIPSSQPGDTNAMGGKVYPADFVGPLMPNDCREGSCSAPDIGACTAESTTDWLSAFNPPNNTQWADPSCTQIPCKTKDQADAEKEAGKKAEVTGNDTLPNGDTVTKFSDGTVSYCGGGSCTMPMTPEQLAATNSRYREATEAAKKDAEMFKGNSSGNGMRMASNDSKSNGAKSGGENAEDDSSGDDQLGGGTLDGFKVGQALGDEMNGLFASNGGSGGLGSAGGNGGGSGGLDGRMPEITTEAGQTGDVELTYERNIENQRNFKSFADEAAELVRSAQGTVAGADADPSGGAVNTLQITGNKK